MKTRFELVDCHAHLGDSVFDGDREEVLARARLQGVTKIVTVGETLGDAERNLELSRQHPEILPAAGLYPTHLDLDQSDAVEALIRRHRNDLIGIGEVGLDYWKVKPPEERAVQREIFSRSIRLSVELDLPLNVHSRSAGKHAVALLLELGAKRVQLHAFDGRPAAALPAVEAGFYFSVPPSVVRSRQKQKLVARLPLSCLLLETDSPVLGADPDTRNEPAHVRTSLQAIAEIKSIPEAQVADAVTTNTRNLYGDRI